MAHQFRPVDRDAEMLPPHNVLDWVPERCYRPRYLNIQRPNYLATIRQGFAGITGSLNT
jgi:hypothetical protein